MPTLQPQRLRLLEHFIHATDRFAAASGRRSHPVEHLEVGRRGEEAAYFSLRRNGFIVTARGWRSTRLRGDIDLVAWEGATLCFVEVKTRTSRNIATAESAVDEEKRRMLRRMGRQYIQCLPAEPDQTRFDVLSIYFEKGLPAELELIRGAFDWY